LTPAALHPVQEQIHNLAGGQMRVKLTGNSKEPRVNAFPGAWRRGQHIAQEWREFGAELVLTLGFLSGIVTHTS
jgi:Ni/Co efflux regulator RcnB